MGRVIMIICVVCQHSFPLSFGIAFPYLYHPVNYKLPEAGTLAGLYFSVSSAPFPSLHNYSLN